MFEENIGQLTGEALRSRLEEARNRMLNPYSSAPVRAMLSEYERLRGGGILTQAKRAHEEHEIRQARLKSLTGFSCLDEALKTAGRAAPLLSDSVIGEMKQLLARNRMTA